MANRSLNRRGGFIFVIFGSRVKTSDEGLPIRARCPNCHAQAYFQTKQVQKWFTLFFTPIFPVGPRVPVCECSNCQARRNGTAEQFGNASHERDTQFGIQMYNSMRGSPANSVTLTNLIVTYGGLGEIEQAISAAKEFHQAMDSSEQCMTVMGRVLAENDRFPEAIQWFDRALQRNPQCAEAAYLKAHALMRQTPPDFAAAEASARAARTAGWPSADAFIREIQGRARAAATGLA
jgi:tetratricopeptide (TPR) repeat protein